MKPEIKISDFLKTGKFGTVEINDSIETVIKKLGEPDGEHNLDVVKPRQGIHYSMYEFMFLNDKLESIQNDRFDTENPDLMEFENDTFKLNSEFLKADRVKKMGEIESEFNKLNIQYNIIDYWGRKAIKTIRNVVVDFNNETWSDKDKDFVKIENMKDFELIGVRYYPNYE
jgi:hypothetical protein